jgi:mycolic acid cyclopropane synthetase
VRLGRSRSPRRGAPPGQRRRPDPESQPVCLCEGPATSGTRAVLSPRALGIVYRTRRSDRQLWSIRTLHKCQVRGVLRPLPRAATGGWAPLAADDHDRSAEHLVRAATVCLLPRQGVVRGKAELPRPEVVIADARAAGLELLHAESFRPHYIRTIDAWLANLNANRSAAVAETSEETVEKVRSLSRRIPTVLRVPRDEHLPVPVRHCVTAGRV